jgi:hypothetical protein
VTTLRPEPLTSERFAPYGRIVTTPGRDPDAAGPGWRWWGEATRLSGDGRAWAIGHLSLERTALRFDWAERHMRSEEVVLATGRDLVVYAGPALHPDEAERLPPLDEFHVFRVPAGSGVVLNRGVWHGAPFAADEPTSALVLLLEGTAPDDVTVVRFPETPVAVEGGVGPSQGAS